MPPKQPTTGERVAGLQEMIQNLARETGRSIEDLSGELSDARQDIAHVVAMGGELARLTGTVESMASDVKDISREQIELRARFDTTLPFLATKEEVTKKISACKDAQDKKRHPISRPPSAKTNAKIIGALVGALVAVSAVVWAVVELIKNLGGGG